MKYSILAAICAASAVSAHGGLKHFIGNGQKHEAPRPGNSAGDSPVWSINSVEPVTDRNSPEMMCGRGGQRGGGVAEVSAGSETYWQMLNGEGGPWVHILGLTDYQIYGCGTDGPCDPTGSNWAALSWQAGDGGGNSYVMGKFGRGEDVQVHIPKNIPNGYYVLRQELLAQHVGAEWYVQCVNVKIIDGPSGQLSDTGAPMFSIPGMWTGSEAALSWSPFGTDSNQYPIPNIAVIEEKDAAPEPPSTPEPTEPSEPSTPPPPAGGGSGSCRARKAKRAAAAAARRQESTFSRRAPSSNWRTGVMHA